MSNDEGKDQTNEVTQDPGALARLGIQDMLERQSRQEPPWLVPPGVVIEAGQTILDLACGVGQWVLPVAHQYPQVSVIGLDTLPTTLLTMQIIARARHLSTVQELQRDLSQPVEGIAPESVAFINARHLGGLVHPARWASLLAECFSWLQPGGSICLCEDAWPVTTSRWYQYATRQISQALFQATESLSVDGYDLGLVPMLGRLLREAGFVVSGRHGLVWDLSQEEEQLRPVWAKGLSFGFRQTLPLLMQVLGYRDTRCQDLHERLQQDLEQPDVQAVGFSLVMWARKPATGAPPQTSALETTHPLGDAMLV